MKISFVCAARTGFDAIINVGLCPTSWAGPTRFFGFDFPSPERRLDQARTSGGVGRALMKQLAIRLSWQTTPAKSLVMFEHVDA